MSRLTDAIEKFEHFHVHRKISQSNETSSYDKVEFSVCGGKLNEDRECPLLEGTPSYFNCVVGVDSFIFYEFRNEYNEVTIIHEPHKVEDALAKQQKYFTEIVKILMSYTVQEDCLGDRIFLSDFYSAYRLDKITNKAFRDSCVSGKWTLEDLKRIFAQLDEDIEFFKEHTWRYLMKEEEVN